MIKSNKLFERFYRKKEIKEPSADEFFRKLEPDIVRKLMEYAVKFIKVKQFHSGFPEIVGGDLEVKIERDGARPDLFHINFQFFALPSKITVFKEERAINYQELVRLANGYLQHKDQIDAELHEKYTKKAA